MRFNRFLITGGCGFIGTSLIAKLLELNKDVQIIVFDNLSTGKAADLRQVTEYEVIETKNEPKISSGVYLLIGDVRDDSVLNKYALNMDCIVHLAANTGVGPSVDDPRLDMECNVMGTFNALEAARANNIKKFIFASSGAPAGAVSPPIHEELPPHPVSPYGSSKLAGEGYCSAYYHSFGINTICLRFGNVYGPRSKHKSSVIAKFIRKGLSQETCEIYGDGTQTRDFIYIDDLVNALLLAIKLPLGGETFQIATSFERTVNEAALEIQKQLLVQNVAMHFKNGERKKGDVKRNFSDIRKAKKILGWQPITTFEDGIKKTINYFLALSD